MGTVLALLKVVLPHLFAAPPDGKERRRRGQLTPVGLVVLMFAGFIGLAWQIEGAKKEAARVGVLIEGNEKTRGVLERLQYLEDGLIRRGLRASLATPTPTPSGARRFSLGPAAADAAEAANQ